MARYLVVCGGIAGLVWVAGQLFLGESARRGVLLAAGVAWVVQGVSFAILARQDPGSPRYMAVWLGSTLVRFGVIAAVGFAIAGREEFDLVVSLLTLAGLLFVMLLLEPWALRERTDDHGNG